MKFKKTLNKVFGFFAKLSNLFIDNHIFAYASQASFFVIISSVPFVMLLLNILQMVVPVPQEYIDNVINEFLPMQITDLAHNIVADFYSNVTISFMSVTTIFLIWTASRGVNAISAGLRVVFATNDDENYLKSAFWSLVYTILFMISIVALVGVVLFGRHIALVISAYIPAVNWIVSAILEIRYFVLLVFLTLLFMSAYRFLGRSKIKFTRQFTGAFLSSCFWLVFSSFYSIYIQNVGRLSYIYGSLTAVVFLMLWLWFCMISMLFGAEINRWLFENDITLLRLYKRIFAKKLTKR